MNEQDWIDLGKRAVACEGWRWMVGMDAIPIGYRENWRLCWVDGIEGGGSNGCKTWALRGSGNDPMDLGGEWLPNLHDPCTLGGLLYLVRDAYGEPDLHARCSRPLSPQMDGANGGWLIARNGKRGVLNGAHRPTEAEALVAALEAAPKRGAA